MAVRLAKTIYWAACIAAVLWAAFVFAIGAAQTHPDWTISAPIAIAGAFVIWVIGRAARYFIIQSLTANNRAPNLRRTPHDAN